MPLPQLFTYRFAGEDESPKPGCRVKVPFGNGTRVGIVVERLAQTHLAPDQVKVIDTVLDQQPIIPDALWQLAQNAARYYFTPLGIVLANMIPVALRKGVDAEPKPAQSWHLTVAGNIKDPTELKRAPQQQRILNWLHSVGPLSEENVKNHEFSRTALKALLEKELVEEKSQPLQFDTHWHQRLANLDAVEHCRLNSEQAVAVASIQSVDGFNPFLLEGVTGSGKTEVYLSVMEPLLRSGKSVLVLVPEIGLTPQTISRFEQRFDVPIEVLHSAVSDTQRLQSWQRARVGGAAIVLGTRSALFTPMPNLGLIIIDEEHDTSFKQQEGFRYHGRDLAIMRAQLEQIPIVLGSATPSLESLNNVYQGRYQKLELTRRASNTHQLKQILQDIRHLPLEAGLSPPLIDRIRHHLELGNQVMLFLNRRGYAPALLCHECGYLFDCQRCDAHYTVHHSNQMAMCHHCGSQKALPKQCPDCGSTQLFTQGVGTEQLEHALERLFPSYQAVRIDRDSTSRKGSLEKKLEQIRRGEAQLLIGTQMLAKGHHFPDVTLVALLDVDSALFSSDFRAAERLAQLYVQVSGRSGRAEKAGEVVLQTHQPEHPLLHQLLGGGYAAFSQDALFERQQTKLPPFWQMAILRAEATQANMAKTFIEQAKTCLNNTEIQFIGPIPSPMERKAGKYRFQALLLAPERRTLQRSVPSWLATIGQLESSKRCRWHLERDPLELL